MENARAIGAANPLWGGPILTSSSALNYSSPSHARTANKVLTRLAHLRVILFQLSTLVAPFFFLLFYYFSFVFFISWQSPRIFLFLSFFFLDHTTSRALISFHMCWAAAVAAATRLRRLSALLFPSWSFFLSFPFCVSSRLTIILFLLLPPFVPSRLVCIYQKLVYSSSVSLCCFPASNKIANKSSTPFDAQQNTHTLFFSLAF